MGLVDPAISFLIVSTISSAMGSRMIGFRLLLSIARAWRVISMVADTSSNEEIDFSILD
jgi:hypothetical protein